MKQYTLPLILTILSFVAFSQDDSINERPVELSFSFQMYPAGIMPGLKTEFGVGQYYKHSLEVRLGYNRARRHSWGEHGDERGGGFGGSFGYKYYIFKPMEGLYGVLRTDIWRLTIDYRNIGPDETYDTIDDFDFGQSKILILQPTIGVGYKFLFPIGKSGKTFFLTPEVSIGWEYNAITEGEAVGQGSIPLWGLDVGIRF